LEGNSFLVSDKERKAMGLAAYEIIGNDAEWRVRHDGKAENVYETKEAAFEAAAASLALRQGTRFAFPLPDGDLAAGLARIKQDAYRRQGGPDARIWHTRRFDCSFPRN
jgi:hypothetical protein